MKLLRVPTTDVNSESARLNEWLVADEAEVRRGQTVCTIETSKAELDIESDSDGYLKRNVESGKDFPIGEPVAFVFASLDELRAHEASLRAQVPESAQGEGVLATRKAIDTAKRLGVDLGSLKLGRLITEQDVVQAAKPAPAQTWSTGELLRVPAGHERILIIGGGLGATQVLSILGQYEARSAVGILDDTPKKWGTEIAGVPIVGPTDRLAEVSTRGVDAVVVAISTSVDARRRYREAIAAVGLPLTNVVDKSARFGANVVIGNGNVVCALCHFGNDTVVGDNNFFSAYNSYDHHNRIGNDVSTGPGCMASGSVVIGDRVRLGTGVFMEPGIELGEDALVASGAILVNSVPARHAVKTRVVTTTTVPRTK